MALYCAKLCHSLPEAATCGESDTSCRFSCFICIVIDWQDGHKGNGPHDLKADMPVGQSTDISVNRYINEPAGL
ncbi:hypothetical protein [Bacteroides fragilis]|uniref:hypothetical protein n=1 Tax=Bacteroides fragilis TaxID=817 RepID=UPI0005159BBF|nr:hypothetical protein [Bacteroides fragilis]